MLTVETIGRIRREHFIKGKTIREIARDLKVSRNTVRKVLRSGETAFEYERNVQPRPKLGRWTAELDDLLSGNAAKPPREQLTLIRIFEELRGRGYEGGYDAVRRYARRWAKQHGQATAAAYVPLSFAPGEAYQFDWSHEVVLLSGVTVIVKVAHVRLCHSRMLFVRAYPRETQEMVFDAHERAFALFKGTCGRGIYDNMKTAVETVFVGKGRLYNRRFLQMCSHYLVEPVACTPASGWEKGQVENQVGLVRERFFTPRLRFKTYDEMNAWLLDKCIAYAKAHRHPELTEQTIWEVFEAERKILAEAREEIRKSWQETCRLNRNHPRADELFNPNKLDISPRTHCCFLTSSWRQYHTRARASDRANPAIGIKLKSRDRRMIMSRHFRANH
jgi:transposase